jgi:Skp family chaperone for outer membrane proteins
MKRLTLVLAAALAFAILLGANLGAQDAPVAPGVRRFAGADRRPPRRAAANELRELAAEEIGEIRGRLDALQAKARSQGLDNDERSCSTSCRPPRERPDPLRRRHRRRRPAGDRGRQRRHPRGRGGQRHRRVMDIDAAAESGLVVYAADGLDLTEAGRRPAA